ncbi:leucine-rich repeat and WD repeat-containing protein 1 [Engraulis encrasicolus]|uniref:leucine-rich repeat and WD repeat-containing protein 1 n=1 Tax=Engraulis encrasicolus TaxID=184585 RepID=UPI002FD09017
MAKITEEVLLEKGTPRATKLQQIKTLNLSRLGLKIKDMPVSLLSQLTGLEDLDLSGNLLQHMPEGLSLPSLRVLDLSDNDMEDIMSLQSLDVLEELNLEDNLYLTLNDQHKAIFLLPKLRMFNGKDISSQANHIRHVASGILRKRVVEIWEGNFKLPSPPTPESLSKVEKSFINDACLRVKYGPSSLSLYTKWRVEMIAREHFQSLIPTKETSRAQNGPSAAKDNGVALTPVKRKLTEEAEDDKDESDVRQVRCTPKRARAAAAVVETPTKDSPRKSSDIQITPRKVGRPPKNKNDTEKEQTTPRKIGRLPKNQNDTEKEQTTPRKVSRQPKNKNDTEKESATPTKRQSATLKEEVKPSTPQKKQTRTQPRTGTPQKPIQRISEDPVCLQPIHVLQCHSKQDDPFDFKTQLWACAFEPAADSTEGESTVATCGGESICLIDCEMGTVLKKYKVPGEEFYSLAWSWLQMTVKGASSRPCSILAAAGKRGMVKLIHPKANLAFGEFRTSRRSVSILRFSPCHKSYLFAGSYDNKISMWDIGTIDTDYNFKVSQLLVLETDSTPLHLALPPSSADKHLIAACDDGLQCFNIQLNANTQKRTMQMEITFPVYEKRDKTNNYRTIDGLSFLSDDVVASKSHMQGSIYLWSWSQTLASSSKKDKVTAKILAELQWSDTDVPYLSLNTCSSHGYAVCGDDKGRLWTYHMTERMKANFKSGKPISTTEVLEWPAPVLDGQGTVEGPSINSVVMSQDLRYLVALSDKNMVVIWKKTS